MIRVISSPSSSTTGLATLIFAMRRALGSAIAGRFETETTRRALIAESRPDGRRYSAPRRRTPPPRVVTAPLVGSPGNLVGATLVAVQRLVGAPVVGARDDGVGNHKGCPYERR